MKSYEGQATERVMEGERAGPGVRMRCSETDKSIQNTIRYVANFYSAGQAQTCKIGRLSVRQQTSEAAVSGPEYVSHWLECNNGKCGFPARIPYSPAASLKAANPELPLLFACPVCLQVNSYSSKSLREVRFRSPDPYEAGKLVLYSVLTGCARPRCQGQATVITAAAANVSVAALLRLWKLWKVDLPCEGKHRFLPRHPSTWWIEEKKTLTWPVA